MAANDIHWIRGTLILLVLGPLCLGIGGLVVLSLIDTFISGWTPAKWFSGNIADWIWGTGVVGDAFNYYVFMVGVMIFYGSGVAIRWGYWGKH